MAKVFHNSAAHKVGIVLAEFGGEQSEVVLRTRWKSERSTLHVESNAADPYTISPADELRMELKPYEVRLLCIDDQ